VAFPPDGKLAAPGSVKFWDAASGTLHRTWRASGPLWSGEDGLRHFPPGRVALQTLEGRMAGWSLLALRTVPLWNFPPDPGGPL
jgi:hypothetical protein